MKKGAHVLCAPFFVLSKATERGQVHFPTTRCGAGLPVAGENTAARDSACAITRLMQQLGRNYMGQFNACHHRTGTMSWVRLHDEY